MSPLAYILAPFVLALALFVLYLLVSLIIGDPARPFRMFASKPLDDLHPADDEAPGGGEGPGEGEDRPGQESK